MDRNAVGLKPVSGAVDGAGETYVRKRGWRFAPRARCCRWGQEGVRRSFMSSREQSSQARKLLRCCRIILSDAPGSRNSMIADGV